MIIRTNFFRPKFPELYKDSIRTFKSQTEDYRLYGTALGNKSYELRRWHGVILVTEIVEDKPQPIGYR